MTKVNIKGSIKEAVKSYIKVCYLQMEKMEKRNEVATMVDTPPSRV